MSVNMFIKITAVFAIVFGIGWLLAPDFMAATYGVAANDVARMVTRFLGVTSIGWGAVGWFVSDSSDRTALRGVLTGLAIGDVLGLIISVYYTVNGVLNSMGWSAVAIYGVFFLGSIYFLSAGQAVRRAA
jgi:hypothetical protein